RGRHGEHGQEEPPGAASTEHALVFDRSARSIEPRRTGLGMMRAVRLRGRRWVVASTFSAGDISLMVLAAFWGLLVLFLALVLLTMFRVLESTKMLIDGIRSETVPLLGE